MECVKYTIVGVMCDYVRCNPNMTYLITIENTIIMLTALYQCSYRLNVITWPTWMGFIALHKGQTPQKYHLKETPVQILFWQPTYLQALP
jgi:hypothetical protein